MFKRRQTRSFLSNVRHTLWPGIGWSRAMQYVSKRALRIRATPHAIAAGIAAGTFASFTPFVGLHSVIAVAIVWILGGSVIAALLGTFVGNPLTFPLIWATTHRLGNWLLGTPARPEPDLTEGIWQRSLDALWPLIKPMAVGGIPLGILAALAVYFPVRYIVAAYQKKKAERLARMERDKAQGDLA